jgi:hypothetical protein
MPPTITARLYRAATAIALIASAVYALGAGEKW